MNANTFSSIARLFALEKSFSLVPRVLFDGWSESEYNSLFSSEDEIETMTKAIVDVLKEFKMDGAVIEIWSQIGNKKPKYLLLIFLTWFSFNSCVISSYKIHSA